MLRWDFSCRAASGINLVVAIAVIQKINDISTHKFKRIRWVRDHHLSRIMHFTKKSKDYSSIVGQPPQHQFTKGTSIPCFAQRHLIDHTHEGRYKRKKIEIVQTKSKQ